MDGVPSYLRRTRCPVDRTRDDRIEITARAAKDGDRRATDRLLRLLDGDLQRIATNAARTSRAEVDDLVQEARLAVLDLVRTWRPEVRPFTAHLFGVLPARLTEVDQGEMIRFPVNVAGALRFLRAAQADGEEVDRAELCRRWSISEAQLDAADRADADPGAAFAHHIDEARDGVSCLFASLAGVLNEEDQALVLAVASDGVDATATAEGVQPRTIRRRFETALNRAGAGLAA